MTKKKIYIAGKVTGLSHDEVYAKFADMQTNLESVGFEVANPIEIVNNAKSTWLEAMKLCIAELLTCDAVYLLPCHNNSKGALIEKQLATNLNIPCVSNVFALIDLWNS
jgi:hypothetical protein